MELQVKMTIGKKGCLPLLDRYMALFYASGDGNRQLTSEILPYWISKHEIRGVV
jgi:hypothetical protein